MIISDALIRYLRIVRSKSLEGNPYQLDDPVIRRYEILREYANSDFSTQKLNELARSYDITPKTIKTYLEIKRKGGAIALFLDPLMSSYDLISPELEKKIIILYRGGEKESKDIL